jgi:hypothetical protein
VDLAAQRDDRVIVSLSPDDTSAALRLLAVLEDWAARPIRRSAASLATRSAVVLLSRRGESFLFDGTARETALQLSIAEHQMDALFGSSA